MSPFIVVLLILQVVRKLGLRCAKAQANSLVELNDSEMQTSGWVALRWSLMVAEAPR
jgi:hypothetical protein